MELIDLLKIETTKDAFLQLENYGITDSDLPILVSALENQPTMITAKNVAIALGYLKSQEAVELLAKLVQHEHIFVREKAIISLGLIGLEACIPILVKAFVDEDIKHWDVRTEAIEALGEIASLIAYNALIDMYADEDESLWSDIRDALYRHPTEIIPTLLRRINDENLKIKKWVIHTLGSPDNIMAFDVLKSYCYHNDSEIKTFAIYAIGNIRHPDVYHFLRGLLPCPDPTIRLAIYDAIETNNRIPPKPD